MGIHMNLFTAHIDGWASWSQAFQSINAFEPLVKFILQRHGLPISAVEHCKPGTNAVFKVGGFVVKGTLGVFTEVPGRQPGLCAR